MNADADAEPPPHACLSCHHAACRVKGGLRRRLAILLLLLAAPLAAEAAGGPPAPFDPGPTTPAHVEIINRSPAVLTCRAVGSRWYAFEFGDLPPGRAFGVDVAIATRDDAVFIVNGRGLPVPLETIYCGRRERLWDTRSALDLSRLGAAGRSNAAIHVVCREEASAVACRLGS